MYEHFQGHPTTAPEILHFKGFPFDILFPPASVGLVFPTL